MLRWVSCIHDYVEAPLCNRVEYSSVKATTRDIILMISCIFFSFLVALNQKQQQSDVNQAHFVASTVGVLVCVCVAFSVSDLTERNFFMLFVIRCCLQY